jgi:hypothetical protein
MSLFKVRQCYKKYVDMQQLFSKISEDSETVRADVERVNQQHHEFQEYKFHSTYNVEILFELKQGQVLSEFGQE